MNSVNFNLGNKPIDPDTYAQNYANQKGITLDEAKAELKAQYGDPQQPKLFNNISGNNSSEDSKVDEQNLPEITDSDFSFLNKLNLNNFSLDEENSTNTNTNSNENESVIKRFFGLFKNNTPDSDPDTYAQNYANEHNITLEEAKAELKEKYGDPQKKTN